MSTSIASILDALGQCWFLLAVTMLTGLVLVFVPQGREALFAAGELKWDWQVLLFYFINILGAALATFFAALILDPRGTAEWANESRRYAAFFVPAVVGLFTAFLIPCLVELTVIYHPNVLPQRREALLRLGALFQLAALPVILIARNHNLILILMSPRNQDRGVATGVIGIIVLYLVNGLCYFLSLFSFVMSGLVLIVGLGVIDVFWWRLGLQPRLRWQRKWAGFLLSAGWIVAGAWLVAEPETRCPFLGPATLVLFSIFFWIAAGYVVLFLFHNSLTQGISATLFVSLALLFLTGPYNQRAIRTLPASRNNEAAPPPLTIAAHAEQWLASRREQILAADKYPVYLVAAEGGGIRAAYWTASILCALEDTDSKFADHLFGVSGVSGGSLGAAVFAALVKESRRGGLDSHRRGNFGAGPLQAYAAAVLGHDFLSPTLAVMLIPDVVQSITRLRHLSDRAAALEIAFESGWRDAVGTSTFALPFRTLWSGMDRDHVPSLFLNSTQADTGRRLVMSNLAIDRIESAAGDVVSILSPRTIRVSTAVLLSARFPGISPIGSLRGPHGGSVLKLVDGGYVDNSGTATADEVSTVLEEEAARMGLTDHVRIVAILIDNNPKPSVNPPAPISPPSALMSQPPAYFEGTAAGALLAPVETLDEIRVRITSKDRAAFVNHILAGGGEVLQGFQLQESKVSFPLGWMLSSATRAAMDQQIVSMKTDRTGDFHRVLKLLGGSKPQADDE